MNLSYSEWEILHGVVGNIECIKEGVARILAQSTVEDELRAENARLLNENAELKAQIAAAVDATDAVERDARAGLPAQA